MSLDERLDADELPADGRNRRRAANRARIVRAFLELVRQGTVSPSAQAVAEEAGVSPRTVFRCFQDMESLYREILVALHAEFLPRASLDLANADRRDRLRRLVENRAAVFEDMSPFRDASEAHRHRSAALADDHAFVVSMERERLVTAINPDGRLDPAVFEALCAVTGFDFWRRLRRDQALDVSTASRVLHDTAMAVLDAGPDAGPVAV